MSIDPELERRVRNALQREAHRIAPHDRRAYILEAAHAQQDHQRWWQKISLAGRGWRVWAPLATGAVATVAVVSMVVISAMGPQDAVQPARPATPSVQAPAPGTEHSSPPEVTDGNVTVPLYYVGIDYRISPVWIGEEKNPANRPAKTYDTEKAVLEDTRKSWALYREMTTVQVGTATQPHEIVKAVLTQRYQKPVTGHGYEKDPSAFEIRDVKVEPKRITIDVGGENSPVTDQDLANAHIQALVWTAQAAAGIGNVPVAVIDSKSESNNKPSESVSREQNANDKLLAQLMIGTPNLDHVEGQQTLVHGWGCTILGYARWRIMQGSTVASTGQGPVAPCPNRGSWRFQLPQLQPGQYTFVLDFGDGTPQPIPPLTRTFSVKKGT